MKYPRAVPNPDPTKRTKLEDKTTIVFNHNITIANIPERCHEYQLGSRSAVDWVIDQWRIRKDPASGIANDPNDWAIEHDDPTYILDLIGRVVTVSMRTLDVVESLPQLDFSEQESQGCPGA
jgi:predicted helicase